MNTKIVNEMDKFTSSDWERIGLKLVKKIKELAKTQKGRQQIKRAGFKVPKV